MRNWSGRLSLPGSFALLTWWPESLAAGWLGSGLCLAAWLSCRVGEVPRTPAAPYRVIYRTDETSRIDYVLDIDYRPEFYGHR
jgi:hypothetical protein